MIQGFQAPRSFDQYRQFSLNWSFQWTQEAGLRRHRWCEVRCHCRSRGFPQLRLYSLALNTCISCLCHAGVRVSLSDGRQPMLAKLQKITNVRWLTNISRLCLVLDNLILCTVSHSHISRSLMTQSFTAKVSASFRPSPLIFIELLFWHIVDCFPRANTVKVRNEHCLDYRYYEPAWHFFWGRPHSAGF